MVKIDKNSVVGISSLIIFLVSGIMNVDGGVLKYVLFGFLYLGLAATTFVLMTFTVEGRGEEKRKGKYFWCDLAPFAVILIIAKVVAGWDFYIVFYFIGMLYTTLNETLHRINNEGYTFKDIMLYQPIVVGVGSIILYVAFSFAGGAPV